MFRGTTILAIRRNGKVVVAGDGQVSFGDTVMKHTARKVRKLHHDRVIAGFAGATADAFTLFEKFEAKLEQFNGNLKRAAVELAKDWRTDRVLRRLEALLVVADLNDLLVISGSGDVVEPDDGLIAIGSGGNYALAAARVLMKHTELDARTIAAEAMSVAADLCVYTNDQLTLEELP
ncbi:MAG TPA: ATP-dependent protease subunit HslV [candidate division Zixibacteria bacterium]|nr:ATP-dependent protease subunit HslV [candidate division Zixibacteria bacterium]